MVANEQAARPTSVVVVMGVSGSGKTTIGALVADAKSVPFVDADDLHPIDNVKKMAAGTPLDDEDRWPWLDIVGRRLQEAEESGEGVVMACSALRRVYRDRIRATAPSTIFLHLHGSLEVLTARIEGRSGHFMPPALLSSQMETLEALTDDEAGYVLDIGQSVEQMIDEALPALQSIRDEMPRG